MPVARTFVGGNGHLNDSAPLSRKGKKRVIAGSSRSQPLLPVKTGRAVFLTLFHGIVGSLTKAISRKTAVLVGRTGSNPKACRCGNNRGCDSQEFFPSAEQTGHRGTILCLLYQHTEMGD